MAAARAVQSDTAGKTGRVTVPYRTASIQIDTVECGMRLRQTTPILAAAWIPAAGAAGLLANVTSIGAALFLLGFCFVPPALILLLWKALQPTPSEIRRPA
jgi:hypothetical protein